MGRDQQVQQAFQVAYLDIVQQGTPGSAQVGDAPFPQGLFVGSGMGALAYQDDDVTIAERARECRPGSPGCLWQAVR